MSFPNRIVQFLWYRNFATFGNKRITRLESDLRVNADELNENSKNEMQIKTKLINRNPRNLEMLLYEQKKLGFQMDLPSPTFWNRVIIEKVGKYLTAKVIHHSGGVLVSASSKEFGIKEQLKGYGDMSAAANIGHVLARRCLESGIIYVDVEMTKDDAKSEKIKKFLSSLQENGLTIKEPPFIFPRFSRDY